MTAMSEAQLQSLAIDTAHRLGWVVARFPARNTRVAKGKTFNAPLAHETKGYPDVTFVRERMVVIEFKAAGEKLRPEQVVWLDRLLRAGVEAYVVRPADADKIEAVLSAREGNVVTSPRDRRHHGAMNALNAQTWDEVRRELGKAAA